MYIPVAAAHCFNDGLSAGIETRATILRRVAENAEFAKRESSSAFVIMQYLG